MVTRLPSRRNLSVGLGAILAFGSLAGCGTGFEPATLITKLRLLGVRAEPAELRPGQTAQLSALVADPRGGGRQVSILWARCDPPGLINDLLTCQDEENLTPLGAGERVSITAPPDFLESAPNGPVDKRFMFIFVVVQAGEERVIAFKELRVNGTEEPLNNNPMIGPSFLAFPNEPDRPLSEVPLNAVVRAQSDLVEGSAEEYREDGVGDVEELQVSWFATSGDMEQQRVSLPETNAWMAPAEPETVQFWVVIRDGRGGTDWTTFTVPVR